ncbi:unnamed protein product [Phaedon cochleariae]|uniref:Carbohydrate sulfotransferase n=1 Tax=Phaedon cochleariae TaxID=80249 RepID=A0A9N9SCS4_PHACE|nr:unnamed protein product [Phaedon cochleariae]
MVPINPKIKFGSLVALVFIPLAALDVGKYPWLEQISRQEQLNSGCDNLDAKFKKKLNYSELDHILVDHNFKLLYCYVPKVACTNWKRVLMVLTGEYNVTNLLDIPSWQAHSEHSTVKLSELAEADIQSCLNNYTLFLVTRHPFERLLSAYTNKFLDGYSSSKYFQQRYGRHIIKTFRSHPTAAEMASGANVTFREFAHYLMKEGPTTNEHWAPVNDLCSPCALNYSFVGRHETIMEDARAVLDMVGAPHIVFPVTRYAKTKERLKYFFQQLSIHEIETIYKLYEADFKLFGYGLEDILGYDLA